MRAVILREFGEAEQLKIEEIDTPRPGSGEVRVKIKAFGLNRAEVAARAGKYLLPKDLPIQLGFEAAGVINLLGPDTDGFRVGDRVSIVPRGGLFAERGTYAEYCISNVDSLIRTPQSLSDIDSAATWMAYLTVWAALIKQAQAEAGNIVIITAASSSLGIPAFQILKEEGMKSIACTRSPGKVQSLKESGADFVIDVSSEDLGAKVKEFSGGKGADIVFDPVGGPGVKNLIKSLGPGGKVVLYGMLDSRPMELTPMALMTKQITIYSHMVFFAMEDAALRAEGVEYITRGIISGAFRPKIAKVFPFKEIAQAHKYMQSNQQIGKIVVTVE